MKKLLFAFAASALLASCQIEPPVSELFFLLDNRSSYDITAVAINYRQAVVNS